MADRWRDEDRSGRDHYGDPRNERSRGGDEENDRQSFTSGSRYSQGSNAERYGVDDRTLYRNWGEDRSAGRGPSRAYGDDRHDQARSGPSRQDWRGGDLDHGRFEGGRRALDVDYGATGYAYGAGSDRHAQRHNGGIDRDYYRRDTVRNAQGDRGFLDRAGDEVRSWLGDDEAAQRREQDQHYRGHGPRGYTRSDERIREDVCDRLSDDPRVDASDIDVQVTDAEVVLSGNVRDRETKRRVEDLAEYISGVRHVQNNLRVTSNWGASGATGGAPTTGGTGTTSTLPSPSSASGRDTL